jgi:hypothetical protein
MCGPWGCHTCADWNLGLLQMLWQHSFEICLYVLKPAQLVGRGFAALALLLVQARMYSWQCFAIVVLVVTALSPWQCSTRLICHASLIHFWYYVMSYMARPKTVASCAGAAAQLSSCHHVCPGPTDPSTTTSLSTHEVLLLF